MQEETENKRVLHEISSFYETKDIKEPFETDIDIKEEQYFENINEDLSSIDCNVKQESPNKKLVTKIQNSIDSCEDKKAILEEIKLDSKGVKSEIVRDVGSLCVKSDCEIKSECIESEIVQQISNQVEGLKNMKSNEYMNLVEEGENTQNVEDSIINIQADYIEVTNGHITSSCISSQMENVVEDRSLDTMEEETQEVEPKNVDESDDEDIELCIIQDDISAPEGDTPIISDFLSEGQICSPNFNTDSSTSQNRKKRSVSVSDEDEDTVKDRPKKRKKLFLMLTSFSSLESLKDYLCERKSTSQDTVMEDSSHAAVTSTTDSPNIALNTSSPKPSSSSSFSSSNTDETINTSCQPESSSCSLLPLASDDSVNMKSLRQIISSLNTSTSSISSLNKKVHSKSFQNSRTSTSNSNLDSVNSQQILIPSSKKSDGNEKLSSVSKPSLNTASGSKVLSNKSLDSPLPHTTTSADCFFGNSCPSHDHDSQISESTFSDHFTNDLLNCLNSTLTSSRKDFSEILNISQTSPVSTPTNENSHIYNTSESLSASNKNSVNKVTNNSPDLQILLSQSLPSLSDSFNKDSDNDGVLQCQSDSLNETSECALQPLFAGLSEVSEITHTVTESVNAVPQPASQHIHTDLNDTNHSSLQNDTVAADYLNEVSNPTNDTNHSSLQNDTVAADSLNEVSNPTLQPLNTTITDTLVQNPLLQSLPACITISLRKNMLNQADSQLNSYLNKVTSPALPCHTSLRVLNRVSEEDCTSASLSQTVASDIDEPDVPQISIARQDMPQKTVPISQPCNSSTTFALPKCISVIPATSSNTLCNSKNIQENISAPSRKILKRKLDSNNSASIGQSGLKSVSKENKWNVLLGWMKGLSKNLMILDEKMDLIVSQMSSPGEINSEDEVILDLPLSNYNDFMALETKLKENPKLKEKLLKTFINVGGKDLRVHVSNMLRRVMTDPLGNKFSLSGKSKNNRPAKKAFVKTTICHLVIESCQTVYKITGYNKEVYNAIADWLNQANTRLTRRQKRHEENGVTGNMVTSEETSTPDELVTSEEISAPDKLVTNEENSAPDKLVTNEQNSAPDKLVTSEETSAPDELVISEETSAPDKLVANKENSAPVKEVTSEENLGPDKLVTSEENSSLDTTNY